LIREYVSQAATHQGIVAGFSRLEQNESFLAMGSKGLSERNHDCLKQVWGMWMTGVVE
jgi:hypothetical protein